MSSNKMVNQNIFNLVEPPIPLALSWGDDYNNEFGPVIDMSQAVPDYLPHPILLENFKKAASDQTLLSYGEIQGEAILRKNYAQHLSEKYISEVKPEQTMITSGCNQAFVSTILSLAKSGEEVLLSNPGYFSHELSLKMLGIKPVFFNLNPKEGFNFRLEDLERKINRNVKAIILVSPNNPTGTIYNDKLLNTVLSLCKKNNIFLILDETYRDFIFPKKNCPHLLLQNKDWSSNFIQLYSFSKSCCIPGHRLGAITADKNIIAQISKVMDNIQICPPRPAQCAVGNFLPYLKKFQPEKSEEIGEKAELFKRVMNKFSIWEITSIGAFFAYVKHPYKDKDCSEVSKKLATKYGIISIPGNYFGSNQKNYLRMSIAGLSNIEINEVPNRLKKLDEIFEV